MSDPCDIPVCSRTSCSRAQLASSCGFSAPPHASVWTSPLMAPVIPDQLNMLTRPHLLVLHPSTPSLDKTSEIEQELVEKTRSTEIKKKCYAVFCEAVQSSKGKYKSTNEEKFQIRHGYSHPCGRYQERFTWTAQSVVQSELHYCTHVAQEVPALDQTVDTPICDPTAQGHEISPFDCEEQSWVDRTLSGICPQAVCREFLPELF